MIYNQLVTWTAFTILAMFFIQTSAAGVVLEYPGTRKQPLCGTPLSPGSQVVDVDVSMRKDGRRWDC